MAVSFEEYFRSTLEDKLIVKMPEREEDHLTPATRLLEKRREMAEVESALGAQKDEFQLKMESLTQRREELERKELQLKESLLKFDKFLKENDSKRSRAIRKANEEKEMKKQKDKEIEKMKSVIDTMNAAKEKIGNRAERFHTFQRFMEKTLESADEFQEVREIIGRYDTLKQTHADLLGKQNRQQDAYEGLKQDFVKYSEEKNNLNLDYNNQLAKLQTKLDDSNSQAAQWDAEWNHIKSTAAHKTLMLGRIKMATHNLFTLITKHQPKLGHNVNLDDTNEQLERIKMFIQDLTHITNEIH